MNKTIKNIRLEGQQLSKHLHKSPQELVAWMGAVQAQDFNMAKWAVALRLSQQYTEKDVEEAFNRGDFLRSHIMRPTWHFISSEDIRWLLMLTGQKVKAAYNSYTKDLNVEGQELSKCYILLEKILRDNNHQTKEEITKLFDREGLATTPKHMSLYLISAEADGIVCSGVLKGKKQTYALLEERAPENKVTYRDEALALLARRYLKSHSPASLQDFVWWSGLTIKDSRLAFGLIEGELIKDHFDNTDLYIHDSYTNCTSSDYDIFHFLPAYDEYIISYKNRTDVLDLEHHSKAFNNYGIFQPVILYNGHVVGNWKVNKKSKKNEYETVFWDQSLKIDRGIISEAKEKLNNYFHVTK